jgi:ABC-2 type transport system ATP-binding protein
MIRLENLTKQYGKVLAVDALNLEVPAGELFGFLGPNGAGKTTTIRMMAGLLKPTAGEIYIDDISVLREPEKAKRICGFIPDRPFVYAKLTGREFMRFCGGLYGVPVGELVPAMEGLSKLFHMEDYRDELIESYSHGMKQRLVMAAALIHRPRFIIVDEPMVGLDPRGAKLVKRIFRELCAHGITIFMSIHTLEIAEEMCDRIGIIQQGRLVAVGTMDELKDRSGDADGRLESIFFKLTGDEDMQEVISALRL